MPGLLWPAARYVGTENPQGLVAAPLGALYVRLTTGAIFRKITGGATAEGWYLESQPLDGRAIQYMPAAAGAGAIANPVGLNTAFSGTPSVIINGGAFPSGGAVPFANGPWLGGYTTAVVNGLMFFSPAAVATGLPIFGALPTARYQPWDWVLDVVTTPRSNAAATDTTVANMRIWAGVNVGTETLQASGAAVSSDTYGTEFPTIMGAVGDTTRCAAFFRFSTAAGDPGWVIVTANSNGAAVTQTVTPLVPAVPVVANTRYRLRLRFVDVNGVYQIRGSVNDGPETIVTANVGPGGVPAIANAAIVPYWSCRTLDGGGLRKSLCFRRLAIWTGSDVNV